MIDQVLPDGHRVAATGQPQLDHLPIRFARAGRRGFGRDAAAGPGSVVTSMAGFEQSSLVSWPDSAPKSVVTSLAGFAGACRPHPPGGRIAIPAAFR